MTNFVRIRHPRFGDIQPPTQVTGLNATATSFSEISLSWAAATDNVGVTGYEVQRATNNSFTTNLVTTNLGAQLSFVATGLSPVTQYFFRVRARDEAGNFGAYSTTATTTTQSEPGWAVGNQTFTIGTQTTVPLNPPSGFGAPYSLQSGTLPTGVTINNAQNRLEYDGGGSPGTYGPYIIVPTASAEADWQARSTASGVVRANNFPDMATLLAQGELRAPVQGTVPITPTDGGNLDPNVKCSGANSLRFSIPANVNRTDVQGTYLWRFGENYGASSGLGAYQSQVAASVFYVQFRVRWDQNYRNVNSGMARFSHKVCAINYSDATGDAAVTSVVENTNQSGFPQMYTTWLSQSQAAETYGLDPTAPAENVFSVNDGPTGANRAQGYNYMNAYWCRYDQRWPPGNTITRPFGSAPWFTADTWWTYYFQFVLGPNQQNSSWVRLWVGPEGSPLRQCISWRRSFDFLNNSSPFTPIWQLSTLGYVTGGTSGLTLPCNSWYDELIVSRLPIPVPAANLYTIYPAPVHP